MTILETPTARKLPPRVQPVKCAIVHATGETDLDAIAKFYQSSTGLQPHYLVTTTGTVRAFVHEDTVAYHAGLKPSEVGLYRLGWATWSKWVWKDDQPKHYGDEFSGYREWRDTWRSQGYQSPLEIVGEHPNAVSVGIELQSPGIQRGRDFFTDAQYEVLAHLLVDVGQRHGWKLTRKTVLGHSDVSPLRRCGVAGSWDPGPLSWGRLWDLVRKADPIT